MEAEWLMGKRPALAKSELELARIVWAMGEATVRQVYEALPVERKLDFWTVQTYLRRLKAKGYLKTRRQGRNNVYSQRARPAQVVRDVLDDFLNRLYDGETRPHRPLARLPCITATRTENQKKKKEAIKNYEIALALFDNTSHIILENIFSRIIKQRILKL